MLFGLDYLSLTYMAAAAASLAAMSFTYYYTKNGIPSLNLKQEDLTLIARGTIKGALHIQDLSEIEKCIENPQLVISKFESAMSQFNSEKINVKVVQQCFNEISFALVNLYDGIKKCDKNIREKHIDILEKMTQAFQKPSDLMVEAGQNVVLNGVDIYRELSAAYTNYLGGQFEEFGRDIGISLALIFIGANSGANLDPKSQTVMMSYAEGQLYPVLTQNIYDSDDNTAYLNFLEYLSLKSQNPEAQIQKPAGPKEVKIIDLPESHDIDISEVPEYINLQASHDASSNHERFLSEQSLNGAQSLYQ